MKSLFYRALNKFTHKSQWYDQFWGGVTKFWYINTFNLDVVNLGSNSGKYAFDYSEQPVKGMNWAVGPQSLFHDFNILKNYFSYLKENGTVIIPLCPFSCLQSPYTKASNLKYYTFLHPATIIDFQEEERVKALTIKNNPAKAMPAFCIKKEVRELIHKLTPKKQQSVSFKQNAVWFVNMWKKQFGISDLNSPLSAKHAAEQEQKALLLSEMIEFCLERNLRPILVIPPVHSELYQLFSPEFKQNYIYSFIKKSNGRNIPFLDYMNDERFQNDKFFSNSFFMNQLGAKQFTGTILKDLKLL